jgi:hypothetical protein
MKYRSYNSELIIATSLIVNVFNDIIIDRQKHKGYRDFSVPIDFSDVIQQEIEIPCILGDRSIILKSLENEPGRYKLPLIILQNKALKTDTDRMADLHADVFYQQDSSFSKLDIDHHLYKPFNLSKRRGQPVIVDYDMTIITKYKEDMDQIISNWIVHFRPDIYFKWWHPRVKSSPLTSQLVWSHNLSFDNSSEYNPQNIFTYKSTTTFSLKTWMFPGTQHDIKDLDPDEGVIKSYKMFASRSDKIHHDENPDIGSSDVRDADSFYSFGNIEATNEGCMGYWAVEHDQEFFSNNDNEGMFEGKYAVNNVFAENYAISGDSLLTNIQNQQTAGDFISSDDISLNNKWSKFQTYLMNDTNMYVENQSLFKSVFFKHGFEKGNMGIINPSGDFLFNYFYRPKVGEKYGVLEFGTTMIKMSKVNVDYDVETKTLNIDSDNNERFFKYRMKNTLNSKTGLIQEFELNSKTFKEYPIKFSVHKEYDVLCNELVEKSKIETTNINLFNGQFNLRSILFGTSDVSTISSRTKILNGIKSYWKSINLIQTHETEYKINVEDSRYGEYALSKGIDAIPYKLLNVIKTINYEGNEYQILANNYIYIVLKINLKSDDVELYDIGKFIPLGFMTNTAPVFEITIPESKMLLGLNIFMKY